MKRPLLVWALYVVHVIALIGASYYALVALGYVTDDALSAQIARHPVQDTGILFTCAAGCFIAVHYLFTRKRYALATYLVSVCVYLLPNIARYAHACAANVCPSNQFLIGVARNTAIFGVMVFLLVLALRSWPPRSKGREAEQKA